MRKIIMTTLLCLLLLGGLTSAAAAAVKVVVEGRGDEYPHYLDMRAAPVIEETIVMVPLQDLANEFSWLVSWDTATSIIYVERNGKHLQMNIGSRQAQINTVPIEMPISPSITAGNIMIPLQFVAQSLGYYVESSHIWNNLQQIYITPYKLISDDELARTNLMNFTTFVDSDGFLTFELKTDGATPGGIRLNNSIWDVLQVYGVPKGPERNLNYSGDWTGKLIYWGTFVPNSGMGTFYEFTFDQGMLINLTIAC